MRDLAVLLIVVSSVAVSFRRPFIGFLCWEWVSLMTPHKLAWGFIVNAPVALVVMLGVLVGTLLYKERGKLFQHGIVVGQILFLAWTTITFVFSMNPDDAIVGLSRFSKIILGVLLSYLLVDTRKKLDWLIWVIYLSVGFYGIKGGIFTLVHGGNARVWGPEGTFIGDNNHLACALLMIMPLGAYLMTIEKNETIKKGLIASIALCGVSVLGSGSRGAFIGLVSVFLFWMKKAPGKHKIMVFMIASFIGTIAMAFMPESYWDRMNSVKTYDKDSSAMGRINAWWCAFNLAKDRLFGGGFDYHSPSAFALYAPNPQDVHAAHSIYFQVLGDHGFVGLSIYLLIAISTWLLLGKIIRRTNGNIALKWANQLARMLQLSLISYLTAGAFLSLSYYDLYWQLIATTVILNSLISAPSEQAMEAESPGTVPEQIAIRPQPFVRPVKYQGSKAIAP